MKKFGGELEAFKAKLSRFWGGKISNVRRIFE